MVRNAMRGLLQEAQRFWTFLLPTQFNVRRQLAAITILLALTAISGGVVLKPSRRTPDAWDNFKKDIAKRAQVDVFDDFQSGLDSWESTENVATWSYDHGGLATPGKLALFSPTLKLTNYNVDSVAQVVSKGLGLVFRAQGTRSYQAVNLVVDGRGPMPPLAVERFAVINGKESAHVRVKCPGTFQKDTLYHLHLEVRGESYTLYIEGQLIDSWSDGRTKSGGVGFFCVKGERARVAWVRVSNNTDAAGRLCAYLTTLF
jgi:hypothetical protein